VVTSDCSGKNLRALGRITQLGGGLRISACRGDPGTDNFHLTIRTTRDMYGVVYIVIILVVLFEFGIIAENATMESICRLPKHRCKGGDRNAACMVGKEEFDQTEIITTLWPNVSISCLGVTHSLVPYDPAESVTPKLKCAGRIIQGHPRTPGLFSNPESVLTAW